MTKDHNFPYVFPRQKLPRSLKTKEWGIANIDYIIGLSSTSAGSTSSDKRRMQINYNLYNNIIDHDDFNYVTNPYGLDEESPARLNNYNIVTPKLKLLEGEEIKRPFNIRMVAVNSEAVSEIEERRKELLLNYLMSELEKGLIEQGVNVQNPETGEVMTPAQIEKYMNFSESDIREVTANNLANYLVKKENLEYKFNKGFKDALIAAQEIYSIGIESNEPKCEVVNPLDFDFDKSADLDFIQDSQWACHTKYVTSAEVLDAYYDKLTNEEVEKLDNREASGFGFGKLAEGPSSGPVIPMNYNTASLGLAGEGNGFIKEVRVEWKSMRKIGFLKYYDENLEEQETIVDETYVAQKKQGEEITWVWVNEVWQGTKIGDDIYVNIQPKTVQYRSIDNPSICKLGYVGVIYNDRNSTPTSIIDLVKHHQYLYNIIMYRMELEIAKAKGKKMVMDIAQIPRSQGIDMQKWLYYFDTMGIAFINSFEEGKGKFAGQVSQFNQFSNIDMTLSQSVGQYIEVLNKIEDMASELMGVSKQRLGSISSTETVGGVERSVMQSSNITEPLFYLHNEVKKHVVTQLVECAKVAYPEGKKINYLLDDMQRIFIKLDEGFINADYGLFAANSTREVKALEDLKGVAMQAISSGMISLKEAVTIFESNSMSAVKQSINSGADKIDQDKQREAEQAQALQQQAAEAAAQLEQTKADRLDQREVIKGNIQKEIAAIQALGYAEDKDTNSNGVPDVIEFDKLAQQAKEHKDGLAFENKKLEVEKEKMKQDAEIAKEKIAVDKIKARKPTSSK